MSDLTPGERKALEKWLDDPFAPRLDPEKVYLDGYRAAVVIVEEVQAEYQALFERLDTWDYAGKNHYLARIDACGALTSRLKERGE